MSFTIRSLAWDTGYFGYPCADVVVKGVLTSHDMDKLAELSRDFRFVTIHNPDSFAANECSFLRFPNIIKTDVNVRLLNHGPEFPSFNIEDKLSVSLANNRSLDADIFRAVEGSFVYSRFYQDSHISSAQADGVFYNWLKNAQNKPDKYFCISTYDNQCAGVMLLSFSDSDSIVIELLSVSGRFQGMGIGTAMMSCLGQFCRQNCVTKVYVGTQERNTAALAFYKKNNFCTERITHIYHMWNK